MSDFSLPLAKSASLMPANLVEGTSRWGPLLIALGVLFVVLSLGALVARARARPKAPAPDQPNRSTDQELARGSDDAELSLDLLRSELEKSTSDRRFPPHPDEMRCSDSLRRPRRSKE